MKFEGRDVIHDAGYFLFVGVLPKGVAGGGELKTVADDKDMVGGVTLEAEVFEVGLLIGHDEGFDAIGLFEQLEKHIKTFNVDIERTIWYYINHRWKVHVVAFDSGLEVVELSLCGVVAVIAVDTSDRHTDLVSLGKVEAETGVGNGGTVGGHDVGKFKVVVVFDRGPVDGVLVLRNEDSEGCGGLSRGHGDKSHKKGESGDKNP